MGTHFGFTHIYEENGKLWKEAPSPNPPLLLSWELSGIERGGGAGGAFRGKLTTNAQESVIAQCFPKLRHLKQCNIVQAGDPIIS